MKPKGTRLVTRRTGILKSLNRMVDALNKNNAELMAYEQTIIDEQKRLDLERSTINATVHKNLSVLKSLEEILK